MSEDKTISRSELLSLTGEIVTAALEPEDGFPVLVVNGRRVL